MNELAVKNWAKLEGTMNLQVRKVLIVLLGCSMAGLSLLLFALYALHDMIIVDAYLMVWRHSSWLLILLSPLLPLAVGIWCVWSVRRHPQRWGWQRLTGTLLLYASLIGAVALEGLPAIIVGYLGMPRRYHPTSQPVLDLAVLQAQTLAALLVRALAGVWLIRRSSSILPPS